MTEKSKARPILGLSDTETVKLDFDQIPFSKAIMQCIKKCSTVRVSSKKEKPSPRIVYRFGSQNQNIREFLRKRKLIVRISTKYGEKP